MTAALQPLDQAPVATFDVALLDLDGVVYRGPDAVPHAAAAIAAARARGLGVMYVTNNANRPPGTVAAHLRDLGIPTEATDVTTAAQAAAGLIASEHPSGARVLVVGGDGLREAVQEEGLTVVRSADDRPAVVVQGFAPTLGWADLTEALLAIDAGAEHIASNLDATLPTERGMAIGNGSLVAAVVNATGRPPRSTGKPAPAIFRRAAARAGADRPFVVGDRLDTDLAGARAAGYPGLHVLTGVDDGGALLRCIPEQRPTQLALDLRGMLVPHPGVEREGDVWRCQGAAARLTEVGGVATLAVSVDAGGWLTVTDGTELDLDQLRAACAAAWSAADLAGVPTLLPAPLVDIRVRARPADVGAIA